MPSNAERLREMYERFWHQRDPEAGRGVMHRDIEWGALDDAVLGGNTRGARGVGAFFRDWLETWDDFEIEFDVEEVTPDIVLVLSRFHGRGKGSGLDVQTELGQVWFFEDGLAVREEMYRVPEDARERARAAAAAG